MRVNSISVAYTAKSRQQVRKAAEVPVEQTEELNFKGKHDCAKILGGIGGGLGSLGAIGGTLIMTGGVALPVVLAYGGFCALTGAVLGNELDKSSKDDD